MSVPQSNSTHTTAMPTAVADRTRRTSDAPLIAVSIGNVTSVSSSSGAMPRPSTRIVTVGAVRSGNTSTGMLRAVQAPASSQQHRQRQHQAVVADRPVNQSSHRRTSVDVAFGRQTRGGRRELDVVAAARHHALARRQRRSSRRRGRRPAWRPR